jgi:hypothetical protein
MSFHWSSVNITPDDRLLQPTRGVGDHTFLGLLLVAPSGIQEGDVVTASFTPIGGTPISASYTVTFFDSIITIVGALAAALDAADLTNKYTILQSGPFSLAISANATGSASNVAASGLTVSATHPVGGTASSATLTPVYRRFRVLLNFPTAVTSNTAWMVMDSNGNRLKNTIGQSIDFIFGLKLFAGVTPVPTNANRQHFVDVDDDSVGRRFNDGPVDVTITGVPAYTSVEVFDQVSGDGAQSSTTVQ